MIKYSRAAIMIMFLLAFFSCSGGTNASLVDSGSKKQYETPVNYVTVTQLKRQTFNVQLISNGKLSAVKRAALIFEQNGIIESVNVTNGQKVKPGEIIVALNQDMAKFNLETAEVSMRKAELDLYDALVGQGYSIQDTATVPLDILNVSKIRSGFYLAQNSLARAKRDMEWTYLRAPFSGRIAHMKTKRWESVKTGEPFCTIIDDNTLNVDFTVMESDYHILSIGSPVRVLPFCSPGTEFQGKISSINPSVDKNGQILVEARINNDGSLLDGMNVKIILELKSGVGLVVPRSAVVIRDNMDVVFRYNEGRAEWVYINILDANSESFVIEANKERGAYLSEGDKIIISGNLNLADGSEVELKIDNRI